MKAVHILGAVGACAIAAAATAQVAGGNVKAGVDAWQAGDYARAVGQWQAPAAAGDPDAAFNLGQAYKYGRGVPQDYGRAIQLYSQAAAHGHKQAEANLGLLMFQTGDHAGAIPHLEHAAAAGDPRAQYYLGTAYFNGDGVPTDQVKAYALMTRAASSGLPPAQNSLAQMDGYLSQPVRQKGTALARRMAGAQPSLPVRPVQTAAAGPVPAPAPIRPAPTQASPIATAALPPSGPAARQPTASPAAPAPTASAARGAWRVQLGAYGNPDKAKQLWQTVSHRYSSLSGAQPFFVRAGAVTRLQAGPFATAAAANAACAQAKAAGQDCIALRP